VASTDKPLWTDQAPHATVSSGYVQQRWDKGSRIGTRWGVPCVAVRQGLGPYTEVDGTRSMAE